MNKIIITAVMLLAFSGANAQVVPPPQGNGNPENVTNVWGLSGAQTPKITAGSSVTDENGVVIKDACPAFHRFGCADLTRTDYYRNSMKALAKQLLANGWASQFPQFKGWYAVVR